MEVESWFVVWRLVRVRVWGCEGAGRFFICGGDCGLVERGGSEGIGEFVSVRILDFG